MEAATLEALHGSIRKWEGIVAGTEVDLGPVNCPLCDLFFHKACKGCPVSERTGKWCCDDTPYVDVRVRMGDRPQLEVDFLKSLLPG